MIEAIRHGAPSASDGRVSLDHVYKWARENTLAWTTGKRLKQEPIRICRTKGEIFLASRALSVEQRLAAAELQIRYQADTIRELRAEREQLLTEVATLERSHGSERSGAATSKFSPNLVKRTLLWLVAAAETA